MLWRAIKSVMRQTLDDYELIIIDDGSKIDNQQVLADFPQENIRYIKNSVNKGVSAARNHGILLAKGKYISLLDDDDEYLPSFLATSYRVLDNTPDHVGFCWSTIKNINYSADKHVSNIEIQKYSQSYRSLDRLFYEAAGIGASYGVTFKAACLQKFGGFDTNFRACEDTELILKLLSHGVIPVVISEVQVLHHNHLEGRLSRNVKYLASERIYEIIIKRYEPFLIKYPLLWTKLYLSNASVYFQNEEREKGKLFLKLMIKKMPLRTFLHLLYHFAINFTDIFRFMIKHRNLR